MLKSDILMSMNAPKKRGFYKAFLTVTIFFLPAFFPCRVSAFSNPQKVISECVSEDECQNLTAYSESFPEENAGKAESDIETKIEAEAEQNAAGTETLSAETVSEETVSEEETFQNIPPHAEDPGLPLCPPNALMISEENKDEFFRTPEKEDTHQIIFHSGFALCYRECCEQPEWVYYTLDKDKLEKNVNRKDNFRSDSAVLTGSASPDDYRKSGFDRGHLAPSADLTYSSESMNDSFFLSNISPQLPAFNRGIWKSLESEIRTLAEQFDTLYIATGPVLEKTDYPSIGANAVSVPEFYYKAVLAVKNGTYRAVGFILPNQKCENSVWDFAVPVDEIERRTNIDFFPELDDTIEEEIESSFRISDWKSG